MSEYYREKAARLEREREEAFRLLGALIFKYGDRDTESGVTTVVVDPMTMTDSHVVLRYAEPTPEGIKFGVRGVRDE